MGQIGFAFGPVDGGVGGGIDDQVWLELQHRGGQCLRLRKVAAQAALRLARAVERHQFAQRGQAALQFPAELAVLSQQQNFHAAASA